MVYSRLEAPHAHGMGETLFSRGQHSTRTYETFPLVDDHTAKKTISQAN